jgi:hypothetical protein
MLMDNTNAWFKFLFSISPPTSTSVLWEILVPCLFYSGMSAQGCCRIYSHVWEYQLTLIHTFFKLCILVFCEQILGSNNYNEWKAKPQPLKYGEIMSECNKDGTHVLTPFPNRDFHFLMQCIWSSHRKHNYLTI